MKYDKESARKDPDVRHMLSFRYLHIAEHVANYQRILREPVREEDITYEYHERCADMQGTIRPLTVVRKMETPLNDDLPFNLAAYLQWLFEAKPGRVYAFIDHSHSCGAFMAKSVLSLNLDSVGSSDGVDSISFITEDLDDSVYFYWDLEEMILEIESSGHTWGMIDF